MIRVSIICDRCDKIGDFSQGDSRLTATMMRARLTEEDSWWCPSGKPFKADFCSFCKQLFQKSNKNVVHPDDR